MDQVADRWPARLTIIVGEYDQQYAGIANTPHIPTYPEQNPSRWSVLVDKIIANGQELSLSSAVNGAPSGKAVGLLDTGTSRVWVNNDPFLYL